MQNLDVQICLDLLKIWSRIKANIERSADNYGLTLQQVFVLYRLYDQGDTLMGALAKKLRCDASNVTGIVDRLENQQLIIRRSMPEDRRAKVLCITSSGKHLIEQIIPELPCGIGLESLSSDEFETLHLLLRKLAQTKDQ